MTTKLPRTATRTQRLAAVRPNEGVTRAYHDKLLALLDEMERSVVWFVRAAYRANEPATMAQDRSAADVLTAVMKRMAARWLRRFEREAPKIAEWFARSSTGRSDASMRAALKKAGFSVSFQTTPAQMDAAQAVVTENVGLIKSIASQHLTQVQGLVMRSVSLGRDLGTLTNELHEQFGVTKRRAAFIARDQNNKATAAIQRVRQQELGITQAQWVHSGGGHKPRPSHVKAGKDKLLYDVNKGAYIDGEWIYPGQLPNCRCCSKAILPKVA